MNTNPYGKLAIGLGAVAAVALFVVGCGAPAMQKQVSCAWDDAPPGQEVEAPDWICGGGFEDYEVTAVGFWKSKNPNHARTMAENEARKRIATRMRALVKRRIKSYTQTTGQGDDETVDQVSEDVSKTLTVETLYGVRLLRFRKSPFGTTYVLVGMDKTGSDRAAAQAMKSSYKNQKALWQKIQADKADADMDAEFDKLNNQ